jgi:hypothetical protein
MASINVTLVTVNGKVDMDASRDAFDAALSAFVVQHETEIATLANAVQGVLSAHPGRGIAMPTLASLALNSINAQPENYSTLTELALQYVRDNAQGDDSLFVIAKGKGGGVSLRSDTAARAKAAK